MLQVLGATKALTGATRRLMGLQPPAAEVVEVGVVLPMRRVIQVVLVAALRQTRQERL